MSLAHGILGFLSYDSMTGYELAKAFDESVNFFWPAKTSQIYLELGRLEEKGLVSAQLVIQTDKPNKKIYTITEAGRQAFARWLGGEEQTAPRATKNAFLLRLFFSGFSQPEEAQAMLRAYINDCERQLAEMSAVPQSIAHYGELVDDERQTLFWSFTADFGRSYTLMCLDWARRSLAELEARL